MAEETEIFWESGLATERAQAAPAGFWIRCAASVFDYAFMLTVGAVVVFIARLLWGPRLEASVVLLASLTAFNLLFGAFYYILLHWILGQTLGKALLRLRVVTLSGGSLSLGTSLLRWIGYLFSLLPFLAGYVMAGVRHDKRALHDLLAGTWVIRA